MKMSGMTGKRLRADMLGPNRAVTVRILRVELEKFDKGPKPVMYFEGHHRGLVLNSTNIQVLTSLFGTDESDHWLGRSIELYTTMVTFGNREVLGIRVRGARTASGGPQPRREEPAVPGDSKMHASDVRW